MLHPTHVHDTADARELNELADELELVIRAMSDLLGEMAPRRRSREADLSGHAFAIGSRMRGVIERLRAVAAAGKAGA